MSTKTITLSDLQIYELEAAIYMRVSFMQNERYKATYGDGSEYGNSISIDNQISQLRDVIKQLDI